MKRKHACCAAMLLLLMGTPFDLSAQAADSPDDLFCYTIGEMGDAASHSKNGIPWADGFTILAVHPDCKTRKVSFAVSSNIASGGFKQKMTSSLFCTEGGERPNPFVAAKNRGWKMSVNLTFADGKSASVPLCP